MKAKTKQKNGWVVAPRRNAEPEDGAVGDGSGDGGDRVGREGGSGDDEFDSVRGRKTLAERNLDELERMTKEALPGAEIPKSVKERVWDDFTGSWKRALDDRVWRASVAQVNVSPSDCF